MSTEKTEWTEEDYKNNQTRVINYMHGKYDRMSSSMKNLPVMPFQDPDSLDEILLSPNDMLDEVEALSAIGKVIIKSVISHMKSMQP